MAADSPARQLARTAPLDLQGDIAEQMVAGVDRFLLDELKASVNRRAALWQRDFSSVEAYVKSVEANRKRFAAMIGLVDPRVKAPALELVSTLEQLALVGRGPGYEVLAVRWEALDGMHAEGLLLEPKLKPTKASLVVIGDCEQSPEALAGLVPGVPAESQLARRLVESGCRVLVPTLINRGRELSVIADGKRRSTAHHREILYRAAYQMGRHLIGYELQKILAAIDILTAGGTPSVGVVGYGEGGLLAMYAAAVEPRIAVAGVSGYFDERENIWREPIDRNVFGLLREFGDAEIATLIAPRKLVVEACAGPQLEIPPGGDSAPARLESPQLASVRDEVERARRLLAGWKGELPIELVASGEGAGPLGSDAFLKQILRRLGKIELAPSGAAVSLLQHFRPDERMAQQFKELADYSQRLVDDGPQTRAQFVAGMNASAGIEKFSESTRPLRRYFRDEIIGVFEAQPSVANPRSRLLYDEPDYLGYEVVLNVFPQVMLYGILLVPRTIEPGEKRPVVVCQHGLEGRAQFTIEGDHTSYRAFAARLAKRGFVTFSPQHLYRGGDRFRTLQRKANPLKRSLFSVMVAQHEQLLRWLAQLDFVDSDRIAFYGISYGGKSAMRIPAILDGYALSICSSDFSDWIWRTVSNRHANGYLGHSEYEIFEFNLGSTFNYAEMAAMICPRPFMAEQFHRDGLVANMDAAEFGRVRLLYENLGIAQRVRKSYYGAYQPQSPYEERETFEFLHEQLRYPQKK